MPCNRLAYVMMMSCMGLLITACSGGNATGTTGTGTDKSAAERSESKPTVSRQVNTNPVELVFFYTSSGMTQEVFMDRYGAKIQEKFPYIKMKYIPLVPGSTLKDLMTAGQTIDILLAPVPHTQTQLLDFNLQYDISDMIKKSNYDLTKLEQALVDYQKKLAGGGIYGLPVRTTSMALFYNKALFDRFGVAYPKDGMTWDETYELAKKMARTEGGVNYRGFDVSTPQALSLNQLSLPFVDSKTDKAVVTDEKFKSVFQNLTRFYEIPNNAYDPKYSTNDLFTKEQRVAMFLHLSKAGDVYMDNVQWDVVTAPAVKDLPGVGYQHEADYLYITSTSKHKDQAFDVIAYLSSEEHQLHMAKIGQFSTVQKGDVMKQFATGMATNYYKSRHVESLLPKQPANSPPLSKYTPIGAKYVLNAFNDVIQGKKDVNTALREAEELINKEIEADKAGKK